MSRINKSKAVFAPKMRRTPVETVAVVEVEQEVQLVAPVVEHAPSESEAEVVVRQPIVARTRQIIAMPGSVQPVLRAAVEREQVEDDEVIDGVEAGGRKRRWLVLEEGNNVENASISDLIGAKFSRKNKSALHIKLLENKQMALKQRKADKEKRAQQMEDQEKNALPKADEEKSDVVDKKDGSEGELEVEPEATGGPRIRIVNGQIELDQDSLFVQQNADVELELEEVDETLGRHVTAASFRRKPSTRLKWTGYLTDLFFAGLNYFGSDFTMISLFINSQTEGDEEACNRSQCKLKFKNEERHSSNTITAALKNRQVASQEIYDCMSALMKTKKEAEQIKLNPDDIVAKLDSFDLDDAVPEPVVKFKAVAKTSRATVIDVVAPPLADDTPAPIFDDNTAPVFGMDDEAVPFWDPSLAQLGNLEMPRAHVVVARKGVRLNVRARKA